MSRRPPLSPFRTLFVATAAAVVLPAPAQTEAPASAAAATPGPVGVDAIAACERAARQALAPVAPQHTELRFAGVPVVQPGLSGERQVVLRGSGSWRAAGGVLRSFSYSCNVDPKAPDNVGLVIRDASPAGADAAPAKPSIEPDLSRLSPEACEASAAAIVKQRWPQASQISFDAATRSLQQESASKAELRGQGRALTAPGAPTSYFRFDCQIDPRDGRVLSAHITG